MPVSMTGPTAWVTFNPLIGPRRSLRLDAKSVEPDKRAFGVESIWTYCRYVEIGRNVVRGDYFSGQPMFIDLSGLCTKNTSTLSEMPRRERARGEDIDGIFDRGV
jgi:hypothetical protein